MKITEIDPMREEELMRRHQLSRLCARVLAAHDLPQEDLDALFQPPVLCDPFTAQGMEEVAALYPNCQGAPGKGDGLRRL